MLTDAGKQVLLEALSQAVREVAWGTGSNPDANYISNPIRTPVLRKAVEGGKLVVEYAMVLNSGTRTAREVGLYGEGGALLWREVRSPVDVSATTAVRDRIEIQIE